MKRIVTLLLMGLLASWAARRLEGEASGNVAGAEGIEVYQPVLPWLQTGDGAQAAEPARRAAIGAFPIAGGRPRRGNGVRPCACCTSGMTG